MTWIVGRSIPFGYSVALSDIRVTLGDGTEIDCLQKIYPVGPFIAMGFAGSVLIGFSMIDRLQQLLKNVEPEHAWEPDVVAEWWPEDARAVFEGMPAEARALGCHLLMIGAHPSRNNGTSSWAMSYVYRFKSPDFEPLPAEGDEVVSIGSGEGVAEYAAALQRLGEDGGYSYLQLEVMGPGGSAFGLMDSISYAIERTPSPGISRHLHGCIATRGEILVGNNNTNCIGPPEAVARNLVMPPVARSFKELSTLLNLSADALAIARCGWRTAHRWREAEAPSALERSNGCHF